MNIQDLYRVYERHPIISTDTRKDPLDTLFFCLSGPNFDANIFAEEALEKGAAHVVTSNRKLENYPKATVVDDVLATLQELARYHREQFIFPVIGLTGSNGKTTTKELITAVLSRKFRTYSTRGNLNNHIGVPLTILEIPLDAEMAVIEMGANHQGEIRDLSSICNPDFGMITNIGKAHIEGFGGLEGIKKGKKELYDHLESSSKPLFVNGDDRVLMELSHRHERYIYGSAPDAFVSGEMISDNAFVQFSYRSGDFTSGEIDTQLVGSYNFPNILAAVCIGLFFKVDHSEIAAGIRQYTPGNNRSQLKETGRNRVIMDAYNANPTSMELAIENFSKLPDPRKLALIGHMLELGKESLNEHQQLINQLRARKIDAKLVGSHFKLTDHKGYSLFENSEDLLKWLLENPVSDYLILLKGSRMAAMERCITAL